MSLGAVTSDEGPHDEVEVGPRLREFRTEAGLSLRQVAERSGLSVGFLSQVERGKCSMALSTLRNVASVLGKSMADFFIPSEISAPDDDGIVFTLTRGSDHHERVISGGRHFEMLSARVPGLIHEPMLVFLEPGGAKEDPSSHPGEEFAYVLEGELLYEVGGESHRLKAGDSLHLRSNTPHTLHNDTSQVTVVVSVVTPRLF